MYVKCAYEYSFISLKMLHALLNEFSLYNELDIGLQNNSSQIGLKPMLISNNLKKQHTT